MINLLTIEDNLIRTMMNDHRVLALLPCLATTKQQLASVQKGGRDCQQCKSEKARIANAAMQAARMCIKNTKGKALNDLKAILDARQLRVIARNAAGKKVHVTF